MIYPQEVLDEVMSRSDIVDVISSYTNLKQSGSSHQGLCPFHKERTPSFSVSAHRQLFHCFGCGESGNVYGFIMKVENLGFIDAVRFLADRAHYTLPEGQNSPESTRKRALKESLFEINKLAARFFYDNLSAGGVAAYLDKRRIKSGIRKRFGLGSSFGKRDSLYKFLSSKGFSDETIKASGLALFENGVRDKFINRLMFPIFSAMGEITGFGGRVIGDGVPKYLNSPETPVFEKSRNLYGINFARKSKAKEFILVEGYMDVIALHQAGFENAVASLGTAFNREHTHLMKKYAQKCVILFDGDTAGTAAALRAIPVLEEEGIICRVLTLKGAKDPDEYILAYGRDALAKELSEASGSIMYRINHIKGRYDLKKPEERVSFTAEASKLLSVLPSAIERNAYAKEISAISGISEDAVQFEAQKIAEGTQTVPLPRVTLSRSGKPAAGLKEARRNIIRVAAADKAAAAAIEAVFPPDCMADEIYAELLRVIFERHKQNQSLHPAELVNTFSNYEAQKEAADVLSQNMPETLDKADFEHLLTQLLREALKGCYDSSAIAAGKAGDAGKLDKILENKRNLSKLNIKVMDC